jgi:hypothetical protein
MDNRTTDMKRNVVIEGESKSHGNAGIFPALIARRSAALSLSTMIDQRTLRERSSCSIRAGLISAIKLCNAIFVIKHARDGFWG